MDRTFDSISQVLVIVSISFTYTVPPDTAQVCNRSELQSGLVDVRVFTSETKVGNLRSPLKKVNCE